MYFVLAFKIPQLGYFPRFCKASNEASNLVASQVVLYTHWLDVMQFKSFFYRCFDGDNALAGLSGHAYECSQMKVLYSLVQPFDSSAAKHLICIDELGKGTEDTSATALCCAALELFDKVRAPTA